LISEIEFDWDDGNKKHLATHNVTPAEFEQVLTTIPGSGFAVIDGEERYRSVGITNGGRFLLVAWTVRGGRVRAVTAFPASASTPSLSSKRPEKPLRFQRFQASEPAVPFATGVQSNGKQ